MIMDGNWSNLVPEILIIIFQNLDRLGDCLRFVGVCKSWRNSVSGFEMPSLPPARFPFLLLAEDVAPGALTSDCEFHSDEDYSDVIHDYVDSEQEEDSDDGEVEVAPGGDCDHDFHSDEDYSDVIHDYVDSEQEEDSDDGEVEVAPGGDCDHDFHSDEDYSDDSEEEEDSNESEEEKEKDSGHVRVVAEEDIGDGGGGVEDDDKYNYLNNTIGSSRGLYSLLTGKTYTLDLPEAAGRLILGTNKGWLVTLGRDLQVNLLHPLLRIQFSLPPMLSFPRQYEYDEDYHPEQVSDFFIWKVAVSSKILNKNNTASSLYRPQAASPSPIVMAIYGECRYLGFARLGDKVWTDVNVPLTDYRNLPSRSFEDIAYHKGNFYAVNSGGGIFVCSSDNNEVGGDIRARQIALVKTHHYKLPNYVVESSSGQKYLVESSSGSDLLLLVRYWKRKGHKYRTTCFSVWRLDLNYSDSFEDITCTLKREKYLENQAIFIGSASSVAASSSEIIKTNSIYFTDDNQLWYYHKGGGHDMGIFNLERRTIEPHFQGKSIHPISPPLWYF